MCLVYYNIGTENGNSGSPVFVNNGNYLVQGIHTHGFDDTDEDTSEDYNKATRINIFIYTLTTVLNATE